MSEKGQDIDEETTNIDISSMTKDNGIEIAPEDPKGNVTSVVEVNNSAYAESYQELLIDEEDEEIIKRKATKNIKFDNILAKCQIATNDTIFGIVGAQLSPCHSLDELIDTLTNETGYNHMPVMVNIMEKEITLTTMGGLKGTISIGNIPYSTSLMMAGTISIPFEMLNGEHEDESLTFPTEITINGSVSKLIIMSVHVEKLSFNLNMIV